MIGLVSFKRKNDDVTEIVCHNGLNNEHKVVDVPIEHDDFCRRVAKWQSGALIQNVFPELDSSTRELMISGMTDEFLECL